MAEEIETEIRSGEVSIAMRDSIKLLKYLGDMMKICRGMEIVDEDMEEAYNDLKKHRPLFFENWKAYYERIRKIYDIMEVLIEKENNKFLEKVEPALGNAKELGFDTDKLKVLLLSAQEELDRGNIPLAQQYISHLSSIYDSILVHYIDFTRELMDVKEEYQKTLTTSLGDHSQIENLINLGEETALRGDYKSALEIINNCKSLIIDMRSSQKARDKIKQLRLTLLDLKDRSPPYLEEENIFQELETALARARSNYHRDKYQSAIDTIDLVQGELLKIEDYIRSEYCNWKIERSLERLNNISGIKILNPSDVEGFKSELAIISSVVVEGKYQESIFMVEEIYNRILETIKTESERFSSETKPHLEELMGVLKALNIAGDEFSEIFDDFVNSEVNDDHIGASKLSQTLMTQGHSIFKEYVNKVLKNMKENLGSEIDEKTIIQDEELAQLLGKHHYNKLLKKLENIAEILEERELQMEELDSRFEIIKEYIRTMKLQEEEIIYAAQIEKLSSLLEKNELFEAREIVREMEKTIETFVSDLLLNLKYKQQEIKDMGMDPGNIFTKLQEAKEMLANGDILMSFDISSSIKKDVDLFKEEIISDSKTDTDINGNQQKNGEEKEYTIKNQVQINETNETFLEDDSHKDYEMEIDSALGQSPKFDDLDEAHNSLEKENKNEKYIDSQPHSSVTKEKLIDAREEEKIIEAEIEVKASKKRTPRIVDDSKNEKLQSKSKDDSDQEFIDSLVWDNKGKNEEIIPINESLVRMDDLPTGKLVILSESVRTRFPNMHYKIIPDPGLDNDIGIEGVLEKTKEILELLRDKGWAVDELYNEIIQAESLITRSNYIKANEKIQYCIDNAINIIDREDLQIRTKEDEIRVGLSDLEALVKEKIDRGIILDPIKELIQKGRDFLEMTDIRNAERALRQSKELFEEIMDQYEELRVQLSDIMNRMKGLNTANIDIEDTMPLLEDIEDLKERGDYSKAIKKCERCKAKLIRIEVLAPLYKTEKKSK